jgi:hypothetical protein
VALATALAVSVGSGLAWAADQPVSPSGPAANASAKPILKVTVIGDSFTSGEGASSSTYRTVLAPDVTEDGIPFQSLQIDPAHQSSTAPTLQALNQIQAANPGVDIQVSFVPVSGATRDSLYQTTRPGTPFEQSPQINAVKGADVVIVGIGGNDAGFTNWIKTVLFSTDATSAQQFPQFMQQFNDGSYLANQTKLLNDISDLAAPNATIISLGYPKAMPATVPTTMPWFSPFSWSTISQGEADLSNQLATTLSMNNQDASFVAASQHPGQQWLFADVSNALQGHELFTNQEGLNGLTPSNQQGSYHPNDLGQQLLSSVLQPYVEQAVNSQLSKWGVQGAENVPPVTPTFSNQWNLRVDVPLQTQGQQANQPPANQTPPAQDKPPAPDNPPAQAPSDQPATQGNDQPKDQPKGNDQPARSDQAPATPAQPDAAQPEAPQPNAPQPNTGQPDASAPNTAQPNTAQPNASQPDGAQPNAVGPDATQPAAPNQSSAQPDGTTPATPADGNPAPANTPAAPADASGAPAAPAEAPGARTPTDATGAPPSADTPAAPADTPAAPAVPAPADTPAAPPAAGTPAAPPDTPAVPAVPAPADTPAAPPAADTPAAPPDTPAVPAVPAPADTPAVPAAPAMPPVDTPAVPAAPAVPPVDVPAVPAVPAPPPVDVPAAPPAAPAPVIVPDPAPIIDTPPVPIAPPPPVIAPVPPPPVVPANPVDTGSSPSTDPGLGSIDGLGSGTTDTGLGSGVIDTGGTSSDGGGD